jgi:hypothetical protein
MDAIHLGMNRQPHSAPISNMMAANRWPQLDAPINESVLWGIILALTVNSQFMSN